MLLSLAAGLSAAPGATRSAWHEGFEDPQPSWCLANTDAHYRVLRHQRVRQEPHSGNACEAIEITAQGGTYVYLAHRVDNPRVIDELQATVWLKANRPGLQLAAEVVLPRTADPRTGRPLATLLLGSNYTDVDRWQQLRLERIPELLTRRIRVLRTEIGPEVDGREAYIRRIVINAYGGPGTTTLWIDDLAIAGFVNVTPQPPETSRRAPAVGTASEQPRNSPSDAALAALKPPEIAWNGSILHVDGRPLLPRMIRYRGEPLALLERIGFNVVWLSRPLNEMPAGRQLVVEAAQLGLWFVCPPPRALLPEGDVAARHDGVGPSRATVGPLFARVLAWDLGRGLTAEQVDDVRRQVERLRTSDTARRLTVCQAKSCLRGFSRHVDVVLLDRRPLGTSEELVDYGAWLRQQPLLARPSTPVWTTVQTQPSAALLDQLRAIAPDRPPPRTVASEQIRLLVYTAVAAGTRGLVFASDSPLNDSDPETRQRAMTLELLNLELAMIEPWVAAGTFLAQAKTPQPDVHGAVLQTNRSRLLLPIWTAPSAQYVPGQSAANQVGLVVPGVPDSSRVYRLSPGGLQPIKHQRVTGGRQVTLEEFGLTDRVLFAQNTLVIQGLNQRAARVGGRAARLQRDLAARKLLQMRRMLDQLAAQFPPPSQSADWLHHAQTSLQWSEGQLAGRDFPSAYEYAQRAMRPLRLLERAWWETIVGETPSPISHPTTVSLDALAWHGQLRQRIDAAKNTPAQSHRGDFEELAPMIQAGWRHLQDPVAGIVTAADLVATAAHSGRRGVRLSVHPADPKQPPALVETPPVWIAGPTIPVEAGALVCLRGWVQVPKPITGSVDGLLIVESLGGEALAERIKQTDGWREFRLYRIASRPGEFSISFVLTGLGEARIDDVTIEVFPAR